MDSSNDFALANWPRAWLQALDDAALEAASSAAVFKRGRSYADSGCVEVLAEDPLPRPALRAHVTGTAVYTTDVWIEEDVLVAVCDCPHAQDGWFCKHQVAAALVWRERLGCVAASRPSEPRNVKDQRAALRTFLHALAPSVLADRLLDFAQRDREIARELQQWRKLSEMKGTLAEVKPMIDEVLDSGRGVIEWDEAANYARRAEAVLPLLRQAGASDPVAAVSLCVHALRRAWAALEQADDSDGEIGAVCEAIGAELTQAVIGAGPLPASFGEDYLRLQLEDPFGCFHAASVEEAMGDAARRHYRQVLAERWRTAKDAVLASRAERAAKSATRRGYAAVDDRGSERALKLSLLEPLHLAQLAQTGAHEEMLAILREDLSDARAHGRVVAFLEAAGRFGEAFEQARAGHDAFPHDWKMQEDLLRCYEREGRTREALVLRRRQFESRPGVEAYQRVLRAGAAAGEDASALRAALFEFLQLQEREEIEPSPLSTSRGRSRRGPARPDVTLRAEILGSEGRWIEAWRLVQAPADCRHNVLHRIALHLPVDHHEHAVELLLRVLGTVMEGSSSPYREALALVGEIGHRMPAVRRLEWLTQLRAQYRLKRNFVRDLPPR